MTFYAFISYTWEDLCICVYRFILVFLSLRCNSYVIPTGLHELLSTLYQANRVKKSSDSFQNMLLHPTLPLIVLGQKCHPPNHSKISRKIIMHGDANGMTHQNLGSSLQKRYLEFHYFPSFFSPGRAVTCGISSNQLELPSGWQLASWVFKTPLGL